MFLTRQGAEVKEIVETKTNEPAKLVQYFNNLYEQTKIQAVKIENTINKIDVNITANEVMAAIKKL